MKKCEAKEIVVSLSRPGKMPGFAYSLPASECKTGAKLRKIPGSVCAECYAHKGRYAFNKTQNALRARYDSIDKPFWIDAMVTLIKGQEFFRWHDSGDVKDLMHLMKIATIAKRTPDTKHWLPTKEKGILHQFIRLFGKFPDNLIVRLSMPMIDMPPPRAVAFHWTSTVHEKGAAHGYECPAYKQGNSCGECRACWDKTIPNVSYKKH